MQSVPASYIPTPSQVQEICRIADPAIRNLRITQTYYLLSRAMTERLGQCANWCTFAVWASRQAGCTIRGEDIIAALERRLHGPGSLMYTSALWRRILRRGLLRPETPLGRVVAAVHTPFDAVERSSAAVARGNLKVFEEIGFEFARYLHGKGLPEAPLLRAAFLNYEAGTPQQVLLANLQIGLHEQTRLQPEIQAALDAPSQTAGELGRRALVGFGFLAPYRWAAVLAGLALKPLRTAHRSIMRRIITDRLMTLDAAGNTLRLGDHLNEPPPDELRRLDHPDLLDLLRRFEPEDCRHCGAGDWARLEDRMHYIVHLFRSHQYRTELLLAPFIPAQVEDFERGRLPGGIL